ncbi:hypothetical protein BCR35DRAFT_310776 [Leucosporidium creatinivorum]|uniref:Uncharacterized protein n=1 Tax=Leucosporidium creatinivorum TaxID=106004 RepID=A0A1Y2CTQ5_9BASI|nr:hypothetical protein BCR35DRAFT_310776 [Leucosporidium creatinivorum]
MDAQIKLERKVALGLLHAATEHKSQARRGRLEVIRINEQLESSYEALQAAEDNLRRSEERSEAERRRSASLESELAESRELLAETRASFHLRHEAFLEEKDNLETELGTLLDHVQDLEQEQEHHRGAPPSSSTDKVSALQTQIAETTRELNSTKMNYLMLEDRYAKLEGEKAALAEQIKSSEAELATQKAQGKTSAALKNDLALSKGETSLALHKLNAAETRLNQQARVHEQLKSSSLAILRPLVAFDLARYYFASLHLLERPGESLEVENGSIKLAYHNWHWRNACDLQRLSARSLGIPEADAATLDSINLHHNRNRAAHTTLEDVVSRAELLDQLGGTTLAKSFVPLLELDKFKAALAQRIKELNEVESSKSLVLPGEELGGAGESDGVGIGRDATRRGCGRGRGRNDYSSSLRSAFTIARVAKPNSCLAVAEGFKLARACSDPSYEGQQHLVYHEGDAHSTERSFHRRRF